MRKMPRRPRRRGISYIENDNDRSISFSKRRDGLFRMASNLSTLTGARMAIVVESENGKMSGFGAPSVGTVVDSFLSGDGAPAGPHAQEKDRVAKLRSKLLELEENKAVLEQKKKESLAHAKEIQESSLMGKLVYCNVEDLSVDELNELLRGLARIDQEIQALLPPPPQAEIGGGLGEPSLWLSSPPPHSHQIQTPPRCLPWISTFQSQPSLQVLRPSHTLPRSTRPQSSPIMHPVVQPSSSLQTLSMLLLQRTQLSQRTSLMVQPQAHMTSLPSEAHQYNTSEQLSQTSLLSSPPPPPPPPPTSAVQIPSQPLEPETPFQALNLLNPEVPSQNHANPHPILGNSEVSRFSGGSYIAAHPFDSHQQPPLLPCNDTDTYFGANGGQASGGHNVTCPAGLNEETYEWLSKTLLGSSSEGESDSDDDGAAGDSLDVLDWFADH